MPTEAIVALIALAGVVASAAIGYVVAERRLRADRKLERALEYLIRDLLSLPDTPARRFATICKHLKGIPEDDVRRALIQAHAVCFETEQGEEVWGLAHRLKEAMTPAAEEPFRLVVDLYSRTSFVEEPSADLSALDREGAGHDAYAAARADLVEFLENRRALLPVLGMADDGSIRASWRYRTDGEDRQLRARFAGNGAVSYAWEVQFEGREVRSCEGRDTIAGFARTLSFLLPWANGIGEAPDTIAE